MIEMYTGAQSVKRGGATKREKLRNRLGIRWILKKNRLGCTETLSFV